MTQQLPSERPPSTTVDAARAYITLLFNRYRNSLRRYLCRLVPADDAAELVQETYFRLLRQGEIVQVEAMARAYLFHVATNLARDHRRRSFTRPDGQHEQLDDHEIPEEHQGPDQYLAGEQAFALLERALAELPQDTRMVFVLHRFRDMSYPQIAKIMSLSARTVARKMAEAIERLSAALELAT